MNAKEKYNLCFKLTRSAIEKIKLRRRDDRTSLELLGFAVNYFKDAQYYADKGMYATALEAIAYAHGFIDAGVIAGFFEIPGYHLTKTKKK